MISTASSSSRARLPGSAWHSCSGTSAMAASKSPFARWARWTSRRSRVPCQWRARVSELTIKTDVERALGGITNPRDGRDVVAAGMVKDVTVDSAGAVTFTFVLTREDPGSLARQARKAVEGVAGVTAVKMNVVDSAAGGQSAARPSGRPAAQQPPPPPTPDEMPALGKVLAISSGKGGVGKSTVSANLAAALARDGHRV